MEPIESLRDAIARVFRSWEAFPGAAAKFYIVGVMDTARDRYTLTHIDFDGERYQSHLLAQLEIRDGKIWILTDNTEEGVAAELVSEGISKSAIVLGFYSPAMRNMGEFAAA